MKALITEITNSYVLTMLFIRKVAVNIIYHALITLHKYENVDNEPFVILRAQTTRITYLTAFGKATVFDVHLFFAIYERKNAKRKTRH